MTRLFLGGVPTDADVRRLLEAFPSIQPGDTISYEQVAKIIGVARGTNRFLSVTNAWRRTVTRSLNFVLETVPGVGFRRRTELERSQKNRVGWRQDQARAARKVRDMARTDTTEFDERQLKSHDHARRVLQAHMEHTATTVKELAPPPRPELLPKMQPPSTDKS